MTAGTDSSRTLRTQPQVDQNPQRRRHPAAKSDQQTSIKSDDHMCWTSHRERERERDKAILEARKLTDESYHTCFSSCR